MSFTAIAEAVEGNFTRFSPKPFRCNFSFSAVDGEVLLSLLAKQKMVLVKHFSKSNVHEYALYCCQMSMYNYHPD